MVLGTLQPSILLSARLTALLPSRFGNGSIRRSRTGCSAGRPMKGRMEVCRSAGSLSDSNHGEARPSHTATSEAPDHQNQNAGAALPCFSTTREAERNPSADETPCFDCRDESGTDPSVRPKAFFEAPQKSTPCFDCKDDDDSVTYPSVFPQAFLSFLQCNGIDPALYHAARQLPRHVRMRQGSTAADVAAVEAELGVVLEPLAWLPGFYSIPPSVSVASSSAYRQAPQRRQIPADSCEGWARTVSHASREPAKVTKAHSFRERLEQL